MTELAKPILPGDAGSDYERYLRTDELLALQKTAAEWIHRDELLFQSVHQTSEIWLKLAWNEIEEAAQLVNAADLPAALRLLRRANDCLKLVTLALDMLEHMSPWEYTEVRKVLGHGSGFDSPGFKEIRRVGKVLVINPGSAGEARDQGNGRQLSCALLDTVSEQVVVTDYPEIQG